MRKSDLPFLPEFFDRYIHRVDDIEVLDALTQSATFDRLIDIETLTSLGDFRYAPDKWTVKDILQHIIDTERIMSYRALRFARNDQTELPGYDENLFAQTANAASCRKLGDLLAEFALVRQSTIALFKSFQDDTLLREGVSFNKRITVLALGFVIVGHPMHHVSVIRERYVPMLKQEHGWNG